MNSKQIWIFIVLLGFFQKSSWAYHIDLPSAHDNIEIEDENITNCEETEYNFFGCTVGERIADFFQGEGIAFGSLDNDYDFTNFQDLNVRFLGKKLASDLIDHLDGIFEDGYGTTTLDKFDPKWLSKKKTIFCNGFDDSVNVAHDQFYFNGSMDLLELKGASEIGYYKNSPPAVVNVGTTISEFLWGISYHMIEYYKFCDFGDLNLRDFGAKVGHGLISFLQKHGSRYGDPKRLLLGLFEKRAKFCWGIDDAIIEVRNKEWQKSGLIDLMKFHSDNDSKYLESILSKI